MPDRFTSAQRDALDALADLRDLDELGRLPDEAVHLLRTHGFDASVQERFATFSRLLAGRDGEIVVVDLVADPVPALEPPTPHRIGQRTVLVDTAREIMANKLCALLGRSELRDLVDLKALLDAGRELGPALVDAAQKDTGFSPIQLAWTVRGFPLNRVAAAEGLDPAGVDQLRDFRDRLVVQLLGETAPA